MPTPRRIALLDEQPTKQEEQISLLGADLYVDDEDTAGQDDIAWGSDPFDILAHRQEHGDH